MVVVITGITGFAGSFLAELLAREKGVEIHGLSRTGTWPASFPPIPQIKLHKTCWDNPCQVKETLRGIGPSQVYHLAGYSQTWKSHQEVAVTWTGNLQTTLALLEAIRESGLKPRILVAGSGLIYGPATQARDLKDEESPFFPDSPYAASKAAVDWLALQFGKSVGLEIVRARPFNHIGPRQGTDFAIASFSAKIACIEAGLMPPLLQTGPLNSPRDLTDVRDMARAYALLMQKGVSGQAYNIATGKPVVMREALEKLLEMSERRDIRVEEKASMSGKEEKGIAFAGVEKLRQATGWQPEISLEQTLRDTLAYWRGQVKEEIAKNKDGSV
ncbi:MAG: NAD-dependent epimerase/dehydratase family protein [Gemmataceae bacterium]|nr:NAD-dependent epimerase/dehydratase family protein [Gemmataceae bacterium]